MTNPIHITRLFRADRLRRESRLRSVIVKPTQTDQSANDARCFYRDCVVFIICAALAVSAFWLAILGIL